MYENNHPHTIIPTRCPPRSSFYCLSLVAMEAAWGAERAEQEEGVEGAVESAVGQMGWPGEAGRAGSTAEALGGSRVVQGLSLGW